MPCRDSTRTRETTEGVLTLSRGGGREREILPSHSIHLTSRSDASASASAGALSLPGPFACLRASSSSRGAAGGGGEAVELHGGPTGQQPPPPTKR